jgi:hypothetical protein
MSPIGSIPLVSILSSLANPPSRRQPVHPRPRRLATLVGRLGLALALLAPNMAAAASANLQGPTDEEVRAAIAGVAALPLTSTPLRLRRLAAERLLPVAVENPAPPEKEHVLSKQLVDRLSSEGDTQFMDEARLHGGAVLSSDVELVKQLLKLLRSTRPTEGAKVAFLDGLLLILRADRHIAELAVADARVIVAGAAESAGVSTSDLRRAQAHLKTAENRLSNGMQALGQGDADRALQHWVKAWGFSDSVSDVWDLKYEGDFDRDGLLDLLELRIGSSVFAADSDSDGLLDSYEFDSLMPHALPNLADTDGDGVLDSQEDLDDDGLTNAQEAALGTDPLLADTDGDSLSDSVEALSPTLDPMVGDTDSDGLVDDSELRLGTDPANPDSDADGTADGLDTYSQFITFPDLGLSVRLTGAGDHLKGLRAHPLEGVGGLSDTVGLVKAFVDITDPEPVLGARVTLEFDPGLVPGGDVAGLRIFRFDDEEGTLEILGGQEVDAGANTISADTPELSPVGVVYLPAWKVTFASTVGPSRALRSPGLSLAVWPSTGIGQTSLDDDVTPSPTLEPTPDATATPTPEPSSTPGVPLTETATEVAASTPTDTPLPESTPTPTETPIPEGEIETPPLLELPEQALRLAASAPASGYDFLVAGGEAQQSRPAAAYGSSAGQYLLAWTEAGTPGVIRGRLISRAGEPVGAEFLIVEGQVAEPFWPELAYDPAQDRYLLVWSERNGRRISQPYFTQDAFNLYALALEGNGAPLASPTLVTDQLTFFDIRPAYDVAHNPNRSEFAIAWEQPPGTIVGVIAHPHRVMLQRFDASASPLGSPATVRVGAVSSIALGFSTVSDEYLVTWDMFLTGATGYELAGHRWDGGTLAAKGGAFFLNAYATGWQANTSIAYAPSTNAFLILFDDTRPTIPGAYQPDLWAQLVQAGTGGLLGGNFPVLTDPSFVTRGDLGFSPAEGKFLAVGLVNSTNQLARYVTDQGVALEEPFPLSDQPSAYPKLSARSDGTELDRTWVLAWESGGDVYGRLFPQAALGDDSDFDGLTDAEEIAGFLTQFGSRVFTDPFKADSDSDGIPDGDEAGPLVTSSGTPFRRILCHPRNPDTDGDEAEDFVELFGLANPLSPFDPDSDDDELTDGAEVNDFGTDPQVKDTDGDTFTDGDEVSAGEDPLLRTQRVDSLKVASEFMIGAVCGEICIDEPDHGNLAFFGGFFISGAISVVPFPPAMVIGLLADLRDFIASVAHGDLGSIGINALALAPWVGDVADIVGTVGKFALKHASVVGEIAPFIARLDWLPDAARLSSLRASWGDEVIDALTTVGIDPARALRLTKAGVDLRAVRLALQHETLSHMRRLGEFLRQLPIDDATGLLRGNTVTVNLKNLGCAQLSGQPRRVLGALANVKGAYTEWLVQGLRGAENWSVLGKAKHVNAAGYDLILHNGGVVRLVEAKGREALSLADLDNYFGIGSDGLLRLNVEYFREFTRGIPIAGSAFEAGRLQIEIFVNSSTLARSEDIVRSLVREMGLEEGASILARYEVVVDGVKTPRFVEALLTPFSG